MAATVETLRPRARIFQDEALRAGKAFRPRCPMTVLPGPKDVPWDRRTEPRGVWLARQIPETDSGSPPDPAETAGIMDAQLQPRKSASTSRWLIPNSNVSETTETVVGTPIRDRRRTSAHVRRLPTLGKHLEAENRRFSIQQPRTSGICQFLTMLLVKNVNSIFIHLNMSY